MEPVVQPHAEVLSPSIPLSASHSDDRARRWSVLFLHSGLEVTGAWTYAKALERAWAGRHRVFWINDSLEGEESPALRLPMRKKLFPGGVWNAVRTAAFIRQNRISILHAHSRRSNMVAAMAARLTGVPYVTTAHLCMKPHVYNRLWPCFGDHAIAICGNVQANLLGAHHLPPERVSLIRNGIDLSFFHPMERPPSAYRWVIVLGRLSGHRWRAAAWILSQAREILERYPDVRFRFVGALAAEHRAEFEAMAKSLPNGGGEPRLDATGFVRDVRPWIAQSALVIGAGRSLLESLAMERPVIALGEECAFGLLTPQNFRAAQRANFGDFNGNPSGSAFYDRDLVLAGIRSVLEGTADVASLAAWGRRQVDLYYNLQKVAWETEQVYWNCLELNLRFRDANGGRRF